MQTKSRKWCDGVTTENAQILFLVQYFCWLSCCGGKTALGQDAVSEIAKTQIRLCQTTFELCKLVSRVALMQESWLSGPPVYWEDSSCSVQSSTAHTNLQMS